MKKIIRYDLIKKNWKKAASGATCTTKIENNEIREQNGDANTPKALTAFIFVFSE